MASLPLVIRASTSGKSPMSFSSSVSNGMVNVGYGVMGRGPLSRRMTVQSMIREIFMPALSSTMTEGKIVSWIKSEGDVLSKGESVVVVESDKADMDVETFYDVIFGGDCGAGGGDGAGGISDWVAIGVGGGSGGSEGQGCEQ
ncbi:unnamed protein product [Rhodiola kirilowii]